MEGTKNKWPRKRSKVTSTLLYKIIPDCLNFRGLAPASLSNQPQPAKSAIFGKIGGKTINLSGTFLHNSVQGSQIRLVRGLVKFVPAH